MTGEEVERAPVCRCVKCGYIIDFCTRDNPCPECGSSLFNVEYGLKGGTPEKRGLLKEN